MLPGHSLSWFPASSVHPLSDCKQQNRRNRYYKQPREAAQRRHSRNHTDVCHYSGKGAQGAKAALLHGLMLVLKDYSAAFKPYFHRFYLPPIWNTDNGLFASPAAVLSGIGAALPGLPDNHAPGVQGDLSCHGSPISE